MGVYLLRTPDKIEIITLNRLLTEFVVEVDGQCFSLAGIPLREVDTRDGYFFAHYAIPRTEEHVRMLCGPHWRYVELYSQIPMTFNNLVPERIFSELLPGRKLVLQTLTPREVVNLLVALIFHAHVLEVKITEREQYMERYSKDKLFITDSDVDVDEQQYLIWVESNFQRKLCEALVTLLATIRYLYFGHDTPILESRIFHHMLANEVRNIREANICRRIRRLEPVCEDYLYSAQCGVILFRRRNEL